MWYGHADAVGRISPTGEVTEYRLPTPNALAGWITKGNDGAMWFLERLGNNVGRIDAQGRIREYPIPTPASLPQGLLVGPDHAIWFTEQNGNKIARLNDDGSITEHTVPTPGAGPLGLVVGPDHVVWFTKRLADNVGRMTLDGSFTEYPLNPGAFPQRIVVVTTAPCGSPRIASTGSGASPPTARLTEYALPAGTGPIGITNGPDQALWFVEFRTNAIARMTLDGTVTDQISIPTPNADALQIAPGPRRTLWFTEGFGDSNRIGCLLPWSHE